MGTALVAPPHLLHGNAPMTSDELLDLRARKAALRRELRARRAALPENERRAASLAASWVALRELAMAPGVRVSLFWSLADEIDTRPLLHVLHHLGAVPLLPRMNGKEQPLTFHAWTPGQELVAGPMGVMEPDRAAAAVLPDIVLAPLLAFDGRGQRLGYGAGFYDRTFAALGAAGAEPARVGFCFASQEVAEVPVDASDVPLDFVVTEAGVRRRPQG